MRVLAGIILLFVIVSCQTTKKEVDYFSRSQKILEAIQDKDATTIGQYFNAGEVDQIAMDSVKKYVSIWSTQLKDETIPKASDTTSYNLMAVDGHSLFILVRLKEYHLIMTYDTKIKEESIYAIDIHTNDHEH